VRVRRGEASFGVQLTTSRLLVTATTSTMDTSTASIDYKRSSASSSLETRAVVHVPVSSSSEGGLCMEYARPDYALSGKFSTAGLVYGAYHQLVGTLPLFGGLRVTAGAEVMVSDLFKQLLTTHPSIFPLTQKGPSREPGLSYSAAISSSWAEGLHSAVGAFQQVRMGPPKVEAMYTFKSGKHTDAVAALEYSHLTKESKTSVGFRARFPRTRSTFTASVTSDGGVRACFERALLSNVRGSVQLDSIVFPDPEKRRGQEVAASVRLQIGPQPRLNLELTPLLIRDGPRVWQK
jgi:hypothetical protein